jgi:tetratricopeptide (TPR) repeat protein
VDVRSRSYTRWIPVACILLWATTVRADANAEARLHFENGTAHYALGEFSQAADEYQAAFRLKQDPALLYNAAQAYRLAGNREKALILYRNYVLLFPHEQNVDEVREQVAKLRQELAAAAPSQPARQLPEASPPAPPAPAPAPAPEVNKPSSSPASVALTRSPAPPPRKSKALVLGLVIGGVAAVGLVVGLGVGLGERPHDPSATIGTWTLK